MTVLAAAPALRVDLAGRCAGRRPSTGPGSKHASARPTRCRAARRNHGDVVPQVTSGVRPFAAPGRVGSSSYNDPLNKTDPLGLRPGDPQFVGIGDASSCPDSSGVTITGSYEDIAGICDAIPDNFVPTTASSAFGQFIARLYAIEATSTSNDDFVRTAAAEIGGFTAGRFGLVPECRPGGACRVPVENEILGGSGWRRDFIDDDDGDGDGLPSPARHFIGWFAAGYFHPHTADDTLEVAEAAGSGQSMQDRRSGDVAIDLGIQLRRGNNSRRETIFLIEIRAGDPSNTYNGSNPNEPTGGDPLACWLPLVPC